jgi:urease accessory protein
MTMHQTLDTDLQRSVGKLAFEISTSGAVVRRREEGCAKLRMPARLAGQAPEAIIINTSSGLAGGDRLEIDVKAASDLCLTTQAAEKVYRSLSDETRITTRLSGHGTARLLWLPQETILFDGARLARSLEVDLQKNAGLLAVESVVLGRKAMGESLTDFSFHDRWRIRRGGRLIYADDLRFDPARVLGAAALDGARAFATLLLAAAEAERLLEPLREIFSGRGGVSAWDGKLVARLVGVDGFDLRKALIPALTLLAAPNELPKVWTL